MRDGAESPDVMTRIYYIIHLSREKQSSYERWTGNIENLKSDAGTCGGARRDGKKKRKKGKNLLIVAAYVEKEMREFLLLSKSLRSRWEQNCAGALRKMSNSLFLFLHLMESTYMPLHRYL